MICKLTIAISIIGGCQKWMSSHLIGRLFLILEITKAENKLACFYFKRLFQFIEYLQGMGTFQEFKHIDSLTG
jgi:hypothetical protein